MRNYLNKIVQVSIFNLIALSITGLSALADGPAVPAGSGTGAAAPSGPSGLLQFAPFILMFAVMYFLVMRPQQKRVKEQQAMLAALAQGDEILTSSGLFGKVTGITDKVVTVELADNVKVKMLKSQVSQVIKGQFKESSQ